MADSIAASGDTLSVGERAGYTNFSHLDCGTVTETRVADDGDNWVRVQWDDGFIDDPADDEYCFPVELKRLR